MYQREREREHASGMEALCAYARTCVCMCVCVVTIATKSNQAVMMVCISPGASEYDETINTLKFSAVAKEVTAATRIDTGRGLVRRRLTNDRQSLTGIKRSLSSAMSLDGLVAATTPNRKSTGACTCGNSADATAAAAAAAAAAAQNQELQQELARLREEMCSLHQTFSDFDEEAIRAEMAESFDTKLQEMEMSYELRLKEQVMLIEERAEFKLANVLKAHSSMTAAASASDEPVKAKLREQYESLRLEHIATTSELDTIRDERDQLLCTVNELTIQLNTNQMEKVRTRLACIICARTRCLCC
jgi:hypothetical protein